MEAKNLSSMTLRDHWARLHAGVEVDESCPPGFFLEKGLKILLRIKLVYKRNLACIHERLACDLNKLRRIQTRVDKCARKKLWDKSTAFARHHQARRPVNRYV